MKNLIAINCGSYGLTWLPVCFDYANRLGIKYVEIPCEQFRPFTVIPELMFDESWYGNWQVSLSDFKDLMKKFGISPISVSAHGDYFYPKGVEIAKRRIEFAHKLGVKIIVLGAFEHKERGAINKVYNHLKELCDYANNFSITIALETHGWITKDAQVCLKTIKAVNMPNMKINYDTAETYYRSEGLDPMEETKLIAGYIAHVHLKDSSGEKDSWNFPSLGEGKVDFSKIFKVLNEAGFYGPFSLELEGTQEINNGITTVKEYQVEIVKSINYLKKIGAMENG